ncbi:hypothetical protein H5410_014918 [Solanum commersonii]|uniref:Uncharacterized protein n=1 Tax=Solanum commersonii TaxID=4109 RepID=A0A9J5ZSA3_SOLCO|nr:hypothetical protein H5410_014918 [Solanum commersonii]
MDLFKVLIFYFIFKIIFNHIIKLSLPSFLMINQFTYLRFTHVNLILGGALPKMVNRTTNDVLASNVKNEITVEYELSYVTIYNDYEDIFIFTRFI